jgi:hypothetical protein
MKKVDEKYNYSEYYGEIDLKMYIYEIAASDSINGRLLRGRDKARG